MLEDSDSAAEKKEQRHKRRQRQLITYRSGCRDLKIRWDPGQTISTYGASLAPGVVVSFGFMNAARAISFRFSYWYFTV
jgi:hypothetical protein